MQPMKHELVGEVFMELFMKLQGTDCYMNVRNKTDVKMVIVSSH